MKPKCSSFVRKGSSPQGPPITLIGQRPLSQNTNCKYLMASYVRQTHVSNWMRLVSMSTSPSPFSLPLTATAPSAKPVDCGTSDSDLCDPEEELGRSKYCSSGFGCIRVKGSSATSSLKRSRRSIFSQKMNMARKLTRLENLGRVWSWPCIGLGSQDFPFVHYQWP